MMFGLREEFEFFECGNCGCVQIAEVPANLAKYYPEEYAAETFNASTTKKPKLTKTQLKALNMMKASTFYGSGGYAYVEVDNRGWKSYTTRPVQGLLDKGIITIPKNENRRFYGRVKSMEAYIVYLNPVAWEYPFRYDYDKSLSQVGNKIVQNKTENLNFSGK